MLEGMLELTAEVDSGTQDAVSSEKEEDIDEGKSPQGQLLLFGHAGVTQPSPVDVREIGDEGRLVTIFGRDPDGMPHKWTLVCKTADAKTQLVQSVNDIVNEEALTRLRTTAVN